MHRHARLLALGLFLAATPAAAEIIAFDTDHWDIAAESHEISEHLGRTALRLHNGRARLADTEFSQGVVEFDIAFGPERGFSGLWFHIQDDANYEHFYVRPHQSGQPDASQYQPVFHGHAAWQILYGPRFAAPIEHRYDAWQHVRVEIAEDWMKVYVDGDEPDLVVDRLQRPETSGGLALSSGFAPAWFSNVSVRATDGPPSAAPTRETLAVEPGVVQFWSISEAIDEASVVDGVDLQTLAPHARWLEVADTGIGNIASVASGPDPRTVIARVTLVAERAVRVPVAIGYSDRARAFLDGEMIYQGNRTYRVEDYRFLGTVGLYDTLILNLSPGENELAIAVSENFGGWAIAARLDPVDGVRVKEHQP